MPELRGQPVEVREFGGSRGKNSMDCVKVCGYFCTVVFEVG